MRYFSAIVLSALTSLTLCAADFSVDKAHTTVGFSVKHLGISNVKGTFKTFDGKYTLDEKTLLLSKLEGNVDVTTINTDITKRDDHLRSADFFDATKYPKMTFVSTGYKGNKKGGKLTGNLTIKNITKPVVFDVKIGGVAEFMGVSKSSLTLEGKINRKDFGLTWNKVLETGGLVVGDEVKMILEIEGDKI